MREQLTVEAPKYKLLRQRLLADYPNLEEETVADTLEGITDLHEMIAVVIRSALVDEAVQAGLRFRLDDMRERLSRLEVRAAKKRRLALDIQRGASGGGRTAGLPVRYPREGLSRSVEDRVDLGGDFVDWAHAVDAADKPLGLIKGQDRCGLRAGW